MMSAKVFRSVPGMGVGEAVEAVREVAGIPEGVPVRRDRAHHWFANHMIYLWTAPEGEAVETLVLGLKGNPRSCWTPYKGEFWEGLTLGSAADDVRLLLGAAHREGGGGREDGWLFYRFPVCLVKFVFAAAGGMKRVEFTNRDPFEKKVVTEEDRRRGERSARNIARWLEGTGIRIEFLPEDEGEGG